MEPLLPLLRLKKLAGRIRRRFAVDTFDVFVRPVPADASFEPPQGYAFRWGSAEDVRDCDELHTDLNEKERREGMQRLGCAHRVVLGLSGEQVVFTMWVNPRCLNVPGLMKRALGPHQWFIYKAFTSPEHRGRKLYGCGMRFVLAEMRKLDLTELVGYAHVKKAVSRKGLASLEFRTAGRVVQIDTPLLKTTRVSPQLRTNFPREIPRSGALAAETSLSRPA